MPVAQRVDEVVCCSMGVLREPIWVLVATQTRQVACHSRIHWIDSSLVGKVVARWPVSQTTVVIEYVMCSTQGWSGELLESRKHPNGESTAKEIVAD